MTAEPKIKGITLRHPWAYGLLHWGKDVENRTWPPSRHGGSVGMYLALHGGAPMKGTAYREEVESALHWMVMTGAISDSQARLVCPDASGPRDVLSATGIVAVARIVEVSQDHATSPWAAQGQYHWVLDVTALPEPVPHKGSQGLWTVGPEALARVRAGYREARKGQQ